MSQTPFQRYKSASQHYTNSKLTLPRYSRISKATGLKKNCVVFQEQCLMKIYFQEISSKKFYHSIFPYWFCSLTCPSMLPIPGGSRQDCSLNLPCSMCCPNLIPQALQTAVQKFRLFRPIDFLVLAYIIAFLTFPDVHFV